MLGLSPHPLTGDDMHHRSRYPATLVVAAALAVALAASGCTSKGDAAGTGAPASGPPQSSTTTSQPPAPLPITTGEKHFIHVIRAYDHRLNRNMNSGGVLTETSVDATVTIDRACRATLRKAGDPGRFAPLTPMVQRTCRILHLSGGQLSGLVTSGQLSGGVVVASDINAFNRSLNAAYKHQGNALSVLSLALAKATRIQHTFGQG
jgi:hypothetical protein